MNYTTLAKIIAKSIFYSSIQASWGSVEMSSKFSVINFSKDQKILQRAADALRSYFIIGIFWTFGTVLSLYSEYGILGAWIAFIFNMLMITWIGTSYTKAFKIAAKDNNLSIPTIFNNKDYKYIYFLDILIILCII